MEKKETLSEERTEIREELERTMKTLALLDSQAREVNQKHQEATAELKNIQASIAALKKEKQTIQSQKMNALNWLSQWKSQEAALENYNGSIRFVENQTQLTEFTFLELQMATCDFSESFKIAQGGYGCLYKGEMSGKTVAIRKLHPHYILGPADFREEVNLLNLNHQSHFLFVVGHISYFIVINKNSLSTCKVNGKYNSSTFMLGNENRHISLTAIDKFYVDMLMYVFHHLYE